MFPKGTHNWVSSGGGLAAEFTFVFVGIGQGDCCLVKCPNGKIIMVDCGSSNDSQSLGESWEAISLLRTPQWCGGKKNKLEALILTHPDQDHYNWATTFLQYHMRDSDVTLPDGTVIASDKLLRDLIQQSHVCREDGIAQTH